jgi:hypothetical protein
MKPYYQIHSAGWLFLLLVIAFFGMEIIQFFRQRTWRKNATRTATPAFWAGVAVWTIVATVMLHGGSRLAPRAGMGDGVIVFTVGMLLLAAGAALRWASFWALGQYFTFTVNVGATKTSSREAPTGYCATPATPAVCWQWLALESYTPTGLDSPASCFHVL